MSLSIEVLSYLRENAPTECYGQNAKICSEETGPSRMFIILRGSVKLYQISEEGEMHIVGLLEKGNMFGAPNKDKVFGYNAQAITGVEVCVLTEENFFEILTGSEELMMELLTAANTTRNWQCEHMTLMGKRDIPQKLATFFLLNATNETGDGKAEVNILLDRFELGSYLGIHGDSVSRAMADFRRRGLIEKPGQGYKVITLQDLPELQRVANF